MMGLKELSDTVVIGILGYICIEFLNSGNTIMAFLILLCIGVISINRFINNDKDDKKKKD